MGKNAPKSNNPKIYTPGGRYRTNSLTQTCLKTGKKHGYTPSLTYLKVHLKDFLKFHGDSTSGEIHELKGWSYDVFEPVLRELEHEGIVERYKKGRAGVDSWRLKKHSIKV